MQQYNSQYFKIGMFLWLAYNMLIWNIWVSFFSLGAKMTDYIAAKSLAGTVEAKGVNLYIDS